MNVNLMLTGTCLTVLAFAASAVGFDPSEGFDPPAVAVDPTLADTYLSFFPPEVLKVTDGVYVARGFNRDNPALIEGVNGLIVIDPGESKLAAQAAKDAFNASLDNIFDRKPVKAIIYTHSHDCHINGASVFADEHTEIIAHESLMPALFDEWFGQVYPSRADGGVKMSGFLFLNDPDWYAGYVLAGPQLFGPSGFLPPTRTVQKDRELKTTIAGVQMTLIPAPGETRDIVIIWLPTKKVLIEIGIIYEAFPALVTMRGSGQRDPIEYLNSLKICRGLNAEHLVALHGAHPITSGQENVRQFLTDFSDAIQFVHDQTVRYLNQGYAPGEIKDLVALPPHLAASPYLYETYGRIDWNVFHIFRYYRGYYTGKVRDLFPKSPLSEAQMAAELAGGVDELAAKAASAFTEGKLEWALELADDVLLLEPGHAGAFQTKKWAMLALAEDTMNSQARNMLLSDYLVMTGQVTEEQKYLLQDPQRFFALIDDNYTGLMPMKTALRIMAVNLNASKAVGANGGADVVAGLRLTDMGKNNRPEPANYTLHVRNGILEVNPPNVRRADFVVLTDSMTWKKLVLGKLTPKAAVDSKKVIISGSTTAFYAFMDLFH